MRVVQIRDRIHDMRVIFAPGAFLLTGSWEKSHSIPYPCRMTANPAANHMGEAMT